MYHLLFFRACTALSTSRQVGLALAVAANDAPLDRRELLIAIVPDEGGNREAIRGHQEAIKRPSEPTRGHERASSVIERNQAPSSAIKSPSGGYERAHTKRNQA